METASSRLLFRCLVRQRVSALSSRYWPSSRFPSHSSFSLLCFCSKRRGRRKSVAFSVRSHWSGSWLSLCLAPFRLSGSRGFYLRQIRGMLFVFSLSTDRIPLSCLVRWFWL